MRLFLIFLLSVTIWSCSINAIKCSNDNIWAVLVTGLNQYTYSYGFEANLYWLHSLLIKQGVPPEHIIVFSPNTAAFNVKNPYPGKISIASETGTDFENEINLYENVTVDYDIEAPLTPNLFFDILNGNSSSVKGIGSEKVLKSGPKDVVFFYYIGFGSYGNIIINGNFQLWANRLINKIEEMLDNERFGKIYINIDSQFPASILEDLIDDKRIIARSFGNRYNDMRICNYNEIVSAYTGACSSLLYLMSLEQVLKINGESGWSLIDDYLINRAFANELGTIPNLYGNLQLGREPLFNYIGSRKSKTSGVSLAEEELEISRKKLQCLMENSISIKEDLQNREYLSNTEKDLLKELTENVDDKIIEKIHLRRPHTDSAKIQRLSNILV